LATGNEVEGNFVGTDASGTRALPNGANGVRIGGVPENIIGGTEPAQRNVLSGNGDDGVELSGSEATLNKVGGNYIGTDASGTQDLGNDGDGVHIQGASNNTIGGPRSMGTLRNIISNNGGDGIFVSSGTGNTILVNDISDNSGLGIDLGDEGVTANDDDDPDAGANNLQNFPVITEFTRNDLTGTWTISGTLNSTPNQSFTLRFYSIDQADPSNHGEGDRYWADLIPDITTDAEGNASFSVETNSGPPTDFLTATATNTATGDTSEFSEYEEKEIVFE
jgi:parallel beta-helix repeat protein